MNGTGDGSVFRADFLHNRRELRAAQRLRHRVFGLEYGARTTGPPGLERDRFDRHCLHLGVRDQANARLAGYTRILPDEQTAETGGFYSAGEFNLQGLSALPDAVAELGRTCVDLDYRGGAVMSRLWTRLALELQARDIRYLVGCASVPLRGPGDPAALMEQLRSPARRSPEIRVRPLWPAPVNARSRGPIVWPPLLKSYLRMGAQVCGEPSWDPDFGCLDYFMLLDLQTLSSRYGRRFMPEMKEAV